MTRNKATLELALYIDGRREPRGLASTDYRKREVHLGFHGGHLVILSREYVKELMQGLEETI